MYVHTTEERGIGNGESLAGNKKKCYDHYKNENGIEWIDRRINEC